MLLDAGRIDDLAVEVEQCLTIGEEEWRLSLHLTPNEHVFCCQRDLLVPLRNIGMDGGHDAFFGEVDLRIQVRQTELAAATTASGHLDHAERGAVQRKEEIFAPCGVVDIDLARQFLAANRLVKQGHRVLGFASPFNDTIHAELFIGIRVLDLPATRTADNHFEILAMRIVFDLAEQLGGHSAS